MERSLNYLRKVVADKREFLDEPSYRNDRGVYDAIVNAAQTLNDGKPYTMEEIKLLQTRASSFGQIIDCVYAKLAERGSAVKPDPNMIFEILEQFSSFSREAVDLMIRFRSIYRGYVESGAPDADAKVVRELEMARHKFTFQLLRAEPTIPPEELIAKVETQMGPAKWRIERYWLGRKAQMADSIADHPPVVANATTNTADVEPGAAKEYLANARRLNASRAKVSKNVNPEEDIDEDFRAVYAAVVETGTTPSSPAPP